MFANDSGRSLGIGSTHKVEAHIFYDAGVEYCVIEINRVGSGWLLTVLDQEYNVVAEATGRPVDDVWGLVRHDLRAKGIHIPPRPKGTQER